MLRPRAAGHRGRQNSQRSSSTSCPHQNSPRHTTPHPLERLRAAKATTQLWQIQARDWAITAEALGLSLDEIAQFVWEANWTRTPVLSTKADLPRPFVGVIGVALTELEISAAAIVARRSAAQEALKAQSLQMQHAGDQPAAKHPKLDDGVTGQQ